MSGFWYPLIQQGIINIQTSSMGKSCQMFQVINYGFIENALNELDLGFNHSLFYWFFSDNSIWLQLWKTCCLTNYVCFVCEARFLFIFGEACIHNHVCCTWPPKMVAYGLNPFIWNAYWLRKVLQIWQMSTWWLILGRSSLIILFICTWLSIVIYFILTSPASIPCKTFWKRYFSIIFEFPHSVNYVTDIATILLIACLKKIYVKYFALCPGLSHLPSTLKTHGCGCKIFKTTSFSSLTQVPLRTPNI